MNNLIAVKQLRNEAGTALDHCRYLSDLFEYQVCKYEVRINIRDAFWTKI